MQGAMIQSSSLLLPASKMTRALNLYCGYYRRFPETLQYQWISFLRASSNATP